MAQETTLVTKVKRSCTADCGFKDTINFNPPKEYLDFHINWISGDENKCRNCGSQLLAILQDDKKSNHNEPKKKEFYIQKYEGKEAILLGGFPYFLEIIDGNSILHEKLELPDMVLRPPDRVSYLSKEYSFNSLDEVNEYITRASQETLDNLFLKCKKIWSKYIVGDDNHIIISAADTIFTYHQDKFGLTHYLFFMSDTNTGKSNNLKVLKYLGYRPLLDTAITSANIYQFQGCIEEGQGIILEDEADNIDQDPNKMKIYKVGYQSGEGVTRTDISFGRKQERYWTYCFKAFAAERLPNPTKSMGFMDRTFVVDCIAGKPEYDIAEVIRHGGDSEFRKLSEELEDFRKLLLICKILHYNDKIPDIKLSIETRDKQLTKPLIRLFQNCQCQAQIIKALSFYLAKKRDLKNDTLDSRLYTIVLSLVASYGLRIENKKIWEAVKANIEGQDVPFKPLSYETEEFYTISQGKVTRILKEKFKGRSIKMGDNSERGLEFSMEILNGLDNNYGKVEEIKIIQVTDTSDTSDISNRQASEKTDTSTDANYNNNQDNTDKIESETVEKLV